jgi:hypothetical protein
LGTDAANGLTDTRRFPISQNQRQHDSRKNPFSPIRKVWFAVSGQYGRGLSADIDDEDPNSLLAEFGPALLTRVNLARDRVRPSALDAIHKNHESSQRDQRRQHIFWNCDRAAAEY